MIGGKLMAHKKKDSENWIQEAIKHPGRVHKYLAREFGEKAFTKDGKIKMKYLNKAIKKAREEGNVSLEKALLLAKRLKEMSKKRGK